MPQTAVTADLHQALDVQVHFAPQIAFHNEVTINVVADPSHFFFSQLSHPGLWRDPQRLHDFRASGPADPVDVGQRNLDLLLVGHIDAGNAWQSRPLSLPLLMARVLTDHTHDTISPNDFAFVAASLD